MKLFLVLPNQLFKQLPDIIKDVDYIVLVEDPYYINKNSHKQKLCLHIASMKSYYDTLLQDFKNVKYVTFDKVDYKKLLTNELHLYEPIDIKLKNKYKSKNTYFYESPAFISSIDDLTEWKESVKGNNYSHSTFYKWQRIRFDILMDGSKPLYNKWSFDSSNRNPFPSDYKEKKIKTYTNNYLVDAKKYIESHFPNAFGYLNKFYYPITHTESEKALTDFIKNKLNNFGVYQDSIASNVTYGEHSNISTLLNIGLLTPESCLKKILTYFNKSNQKKKIINSVEGIVRQIIGWREYIRFIYLFYKKEVETVDYLNNNNKMPMSWYKGETDLELLNNIIERMKEYGYVHHIERLMILNNLAILYEINMKYVYKWFMTCFCDSYDIFMINIYMNINSLNPSIKFMKRVYIASDNYIKKMSNYKNKEDFDIINKLYKGFLIKNKTVLKKDYMLSAQLKRL